MVEMVEVVRMMLFWSSMLTVMDLLGLVEYILTIRYSCT